MAFDSLPALTVTLNDLGLKIAPPPAGPKVTLLGITSNTGIPIRDPFQVTNVGQAAAAFYFSGASGNNYPGELALALEEAVGGGASAVEIVVIGHYSGATLDDYISPIGTGPHTRYDDLALAYDVIKNTDLDVVVPVGAWADTTGTSGLFAKQLANFCHQASDEFDNTCIGVIGMMPTLHWAYSWQTELKNNGSAAVSGEVAGLFGAAYNNTGNYTFGTPTLTLVDEWVRYATQQDDDGSSTAPVVQDTDAPFPVAFSSYLKGSTDTNGIFYPENYSSTVPTAVNASYWDYWQAEDSAGLVETDDLGNKVDAGRRVVVVGAPLITANAQVRDLAIGLYASPSNTVYNTDGAAAYAGFMNSLRPQSAPSNKQIANLTTRRPLSARQANKLAARRLTTFNRKRQGHVVASAVTGAHSVSKYVRSDFVRLSTMRIVDAVLDAIKVVAEPFLGEANSAVNRNAMSAEIDKVLFATKAAGALNDYQFFVSATPDQQVLGEVDIDLTLVPAFEITEIKQSVSLAKSL
jgi:hypothetical protein